MNVLVNIQQAYQQAKNYPDLVRKLIAIGIHSYTVDVTTGTILYRLSGGVNALHEGTSASREISSPLIRQAVIQAIRDNQQGKTDYPSFLDDIAKAGVRFYEATLEGQRKRVTYIGKGGSYEELIS